MPTFDIIVPAFNAERYLAAALESVIAQPFADWRILLVDDGSSDTTAEIAARFQTRLGDRMRVIRQPNAGLPAARNTAIRASSAEFLALLDADDVWLPKRLSASLAALRARPEAGLSYGLVTRIDEHGSPISTFTGNPRHAEGRIARYIYRRTVDLPCPTITFRRECIARVGVFDETMRATEDRDLWLRIARHYEVAFIPEVIALYRTSVQSMSGDLDRMLRSQRLFIEKHSGPQGFGWKERQIATARAYKQYAEGLSARNQPRRALASALRALLLWPLSLDNLRTAASILLAGVRTMRSRPDPA